MGGQVDAPMNFLPFIGFVCSLVFLEKIQISRHPPSCTPDANKSRLYIARYHGFLALRFVHQKSGNPGTLGGFDPTVGPRLIHETPHWFQQSKLCLSGREQATPPKHPKDTFCTLFLLTIFREQRTCSKWSWSQSCKLSSS